MIETITTPEAVTVLCLLMVRADGEIRHEELTSMLENPFFQKHVGDKIGPAKKFLKKYSADKQRHGVDAMEQAAIKQLKTAFPALQTKTLALMTLIAGADDEYAQQEKDLMARAATALGIPFADVDHEMNRMNQAIIDREVTEEEEAANKAIPPDEAQNASDGS